MRSRRRDVAIVTDRSADSENHEIICPQHHEPTRKPTSSGGYAPTYKPTRKSSGECEDDETWEYLAGDKGYKRCDHVAKKPDPRCGRVSDDGVVASEACPKTCGTCG